MVPPIGPIGVPQPAAPTAGPAQGGGAQGGGGFGKELAGALQKLDDAQAQAAGQTQQLATGQAQDITSVVMSVEKASLDLQLASQIRNKAVEAYQDIFRMQV